MVEHQPFPENLCVAVRVCWSMCVCRKVKVLSGRDRHTLHVLLETGAPGRALVHDSCLSLLSSLHLTPDQPSLLPLPPHPLLPPSFLHVWPLLTALPSAVLSDGLRKLVSWLRFLCGGVVQQACHKPNTVRPWKPSSPDWTAPTHPPTYPHIHTHTPQLFVQQSVIPSTDAVKHLIKRA